ncbi:MAG: 1-acyl-sn-glycerol-3-phosphate acyltransferase [Gemmatimonas sp.]|nr:1-acyl-sn-glycerol-3-phosphate acyltransferase [Gemmatimonas sp.]
MGVAFLFTAWRDPGRYTVGRILRRGAMACVSVNPLWRFRTSGFVPADPRRPYVVVSNHESLADIFLISHLPWEMKWLSKDTIFKLPVMGWLMRMAGDISVTRSDRSSRAGAIEQCRDRLHRKVSVMIFPEGTRSRTKDLLPFKDGAFRLAIELGVPILPMAVAGTRSAIQKGSLLFDRARAEVRVLEPIPTEGMTLAEVGALRDRVRALIQTERDKLQGELERSTRDVRTGGTDPRQVPAS